MERDELDMELSGSEPEVKPDAPSPMVTPEVPKVEAPAGEVKPEVPEVPLYDLPDGRKVSAEELQKEWKENFLPEYTRKSQKLAEIERGRDIKNPPDDEPKWKKPDYVPENYAEVIELAKAEALREIESKKDAERQRIETIQSQVDSEINELKKVDPKLDENALFQHANKYGFNNLKMAFQSLKDMKAAVLEAEQRTLKNLKTREAEPIAGGSTGSVVPDGAYDPAEMSQFSNAIEYLARIKGK